MMCAEIVKENCCASCADIFVMVEKTRHKGSVSMHFYHTRAFSIHNHYKNETQKRAQNFELTYT